MFERFMPSTSAVPLEYGGIRQSSGVKRKFDDDDCSNSYRRLRYYYQLASESSFSENSNESSYSCQAYETELCFDTPDTDTKSEYDSGSDINFEVEYDVRSSSNEDIQLNIDSSTENEDLVHGGTITALICEPAFEQGLTDGEESDNSSMADYESHRAVFDVCVQCKLPNNNLFFRYCKKCFQVRKSFFPPRPRGCKKRNAKSSATLVLKQSNPIMSHSLDPSQEKEKQRASTNSGTPNSDNGVSEKTSSFEENETSERGLFPKHLSENEDLCILCHSELKNSVFVHASKAHMCCCYKCAVKTWRLHKKCPACNASAKNVVRVFK